jgi:integrase
MTAIAPNIMKLTTLEKCERIIKSYLLPEIGNLKIKDISTVRLDEFFIKLAKTGRIQRTFLFENPDLIPKGTRNNYAEKIGINTKTIHDICKGGACFKETAEIISQDLGLKMSEIFIENTENCGLRKATIKNVKKTISAIFAVAVKKGIVSFKPVINTTLPKTNEEERPNFNKSEIKKLAQIIENLGDIQLKAMLKTLLYTGFRSGELRGLQWSDIDTKQCTIEIKRNLVEVKGEYFFDTTKTKSSERIVQVPKEIIDLLIEQKKQRDILFENLHITPINPDMVFLSRKGNYINSNRLNMDFKAILAKNNLPECHLHSLRHAHSSLLINAGIPAIQVAAQLGHANVRTTQEIYAHAFEERQINVQSAIAKELLESDD